MRPVYQSSIAIILLIFLGAYSMWEPSLRIEEDGETVAPLPSLHEWRQVYGDSIRTFTFTTSPTAVPAYLRHPGTTTIDFMTAPEDMWVIGAKTEVRGGPPELLHHTNYIHHGGYAPFCGGGYPFFASGKEMTAGFFPLSYGYRINQGDEIEGLAMYHNESDVTYGGVETVITFWYIPKHEAPLREVHPLLVDVFTPCVLGDFIVPGGVTEYTEESDEPYVVREPGKVVLIGSHLHDHANYITLSVNGDDVLTVTPEKDTDGSIVTIPITYPKDLSLHEGDEIRVKMEAENPHTDHEHDMMAQMFLYVHLTESASP